MAKIDDARTQDFPTGIVAELAAAGFGEAEEIGHGGFGTVYRCLEYALERHVAVKAMSTTVHGNERNQFVGEQRALGRVSGHPHILQILQVDVTASGRPFLVTPFHSRGSLDAMMRLAGPFSWPQVLSIGVKIAGALAAAHAIGIVHRDVKPANILLTDYGEPQLADFGIAQFGEAPTSPSLTIQGTPAYTAPEVLSGATPTPASDIYALAATLHALLTGRAAFARNPGEPLEVQLARIASAPRPGLPTNEVPHAVAAVIGAGMAHDPADRPRSALEFGERLRAAQRECGQSVDVMAVPPAVVEATGANTPPLVSPGSVTPPPPPSTATKFRPPTAPGATIERDRLLDLLRQGGTRRLVLIHGPAGFGKTTLAGQWAQALTSAGIPVAWLSADPDDDNVVWFLAHLVEAIRRVRPELAREIGAALEHRSSDAARYVLSKLIDEIHDSGRAMVLIVDDWHRVHGESTVAAMDYLLEHSCHHLRVVVSSRSGAGLPLTRMLVHDELVEINVSDLRFDSAETNAFLIDSNSLSLTSDEIDRLQKSTEGWPAALQLASLSLRGRDDHGAFIDGVTGRHRVIASYLAENVLDSLDPALLDFMMTTAITDRMCSSLAALLSGRNDSQELLEEISDRNLFLQRLDEESEWFHYHRLFADFLQRRLILRDPQRVAELHLRAAQWFAEHDMLSAAVDHGLAAGNPDRAADLIEQVAADLIERSRMATIVGLLAKLPEHTLESRPRLQMWAAWANLGMQRWEPLAAAMHHVYAALDAGAVRNATEAIELRVECAMVKVGREVILDRYAGLPDLVVDHLTDDSNSFIATQVASLASIDALLRFDFAGTRRWQQRAVPYHREHNGSFGVIHSLCYAGMSAFEQLDIDAAAEHYSHAIQIARHSGAHSHAMRLAGTLLGALRYYQGRLGEAEELLDASAELGRYGGSVLFLLATYGIGARVKAIRGDLVGAEKRLDEGAGIAAQSSLNRLAARVVTERIRLGLSIPEEVRGNLLRSAPYERQGNWIRADIAEFEQESAVLLLLADGSDAAANQARERSGRMVHEIESQSRPRALLQARLLHACCNWACGDRAGATAALSVAASVCAERGLIRLVTDAGPNIADPLAACSAWNPTIAARFLDRQ